MKSIAIIGAGISGLGAAWLLRHDYEVTVIEASSKPGGHANTVTVDEDGTPVPVDTGFMVFNHVTYPNLVRLFGKLGVETKRTDMSFSVQHHSAARLLEYSGSSVNHLFAQRRNLLSPSFIRMLLRIDRFNREAVAALDDPRTETQTLGEYVKARGYGEDFLNLYLIPMSSAVWSTPPELMLGFPAASLLRFFHNHGFLGLHTQHPWWTVVGGSQRYVERLCAPLRERMLLSMPVHAVRRGPEDGVEVITDKGSLGFDKVIIASHPPATLAMLGKDATPQERAVLSAFKYQPNKATLHSDDVVMPRKRLAWSSWNYRMQTEARGVDARQCEVSTHYWMNRLQDVSKKRNYFVSINGEDLPAEGKVHTSIDYEHPLFDLAAREAQGKVEALNQAAVGTTETYFAGAWQRHGFHEDGLYSAVRLCEQLLGRDPWEGA